MFQNGWIYNNLKTLNKSRSDQNKIQLKDFKLLEKKIINEMCYSLNDSKNKSGGSDNQQ